MNSRGAAGRLRAPGRARAVAIAMLLCAACRTAPTPGYRETMTQQQTITVGEWRKLPGGNPCSAQYPEILQFRAGGLYSGRNSEQGSFTLWDAGTYRVSAPGRVEISTANDAIIGYAFSLEGNVVTFLDPAGCEIQYRFGG
jgi:hypothetical protein